MKKNKLLIALLAALMSCSFAVGFTSCKDDENSSSGGINSESPKDEDGSDDENDDDESGSKDEGDDSDDESGSDDEHEHDYKSKVKKNATCTDDGVMEYKCDCGDKYQEPIPATGHTMENYGCTVCDYKQYSKGLNYALRTDGEGNEYYAVTDKGYCKDLVVIIPAYHQGLPVKEIAAHAFDQGGNSNYKKDIEVLAFVLPSTIEIIGSRAFYASEAVELVNLSQLPIEWVEMGEANWEDYGTAGYYIPHICQSQADAKVVKYENGCIVYNTEKPVLDENGQETYDENEELIVEPYKVLVGFEGVAEKNAEKFEVVVPDGVQEIADNVFEAKPVTRVTLPDSVEYIGRYAFANCQVLTSVNLPGSVKEISDYAFYNTAIESVEIPESVSIIWDRAFANNAYLTSVKLSASLEHIRDYAFENCAALTEVILPEGLAGLGVGTFRNCVSLESIAFPSTLDCERISGAFVGCSSLATVSGAESWEIIMQNVFSGTAISDLSAFASLKVIHSGAFQNCRNLPAVFEIPETVEFIDQYAFADNTFVKVTINEGLLDARSNVFADCERLKEIYNKSATVTDYLWRNNSGVYDVNVYSDTDETTSPKLIIEGDYAFAVVNVWDSSEYEYVDKLAVVAYLGNGTETVVPTTVTVDGEPQAVELVNAYAFYYNDTVTKITFPAEIEKFGNNMIDRCTALEEIVFESPEVTPETVLRFDYGTILNCPELKKITLPNRPIDLYGLLNRNNMEKLETLNYDGTLESWLSDVEYDSSVTSGLAFEIQGELVTDLVIPDSVTEIPYDAFFGFTSINKVTLHENVSYINSRAFYNCTNLFEVYNYSSLTVTAGTTSNGYLAYYAKAVYTEATESAISKVGDFVLYDDGEYVTTIAYNGTAQDVVIPTQVTKVDLSVFIDNENIVTITIPKTVKAITGTLSAENFETVYYEGDVDDWMEMESFGQLYSQWNKKATKVYFDGEEVTEAELPDGMEIVPENIFNGFTDLAKITLPSSVTEIGAHAFYKTAITEVELGNNVQTIGAYAFGYCKNLKSVDFGSVVTINDYAFEYTESLKTVEFPDSVKVIGWGAFAYSGIATLDLNEVEELDVEAFRECVNLTEITLPATIKRMEGNAFKNCIGLTTIYYNIDGETVSGQEDVNGSVGIGSYGITTYMVEEYQLKYDKLPSRKVIIGANVKRLPANAFSRERDALDSGWAWESYIHEVEFADGCQLEEIGSCAFKWTAIREIVIPDTVKKIGYQAFIDCKMQSVTIGNGIEEIGAQAFAYCDFTEVNFKAGGEVASVVIKGGNSQSGAFYECAALTDITLPASIQKIEAYAFQSCSKLQNIVLSEGLEYIGDYAFPVSSYYPKTVTTANSDEYLPSTLTYIGKQAFSYTNFKGKLVIPEGVTEIQQSSFTDCYQMTEVVIGDNVTGIGSSAFANCYRLTRVTFGERLANIDSSAYSASFKNCANVVEIYDKTSLNLKSGYASFGGIKIKNSNFGEVYCHVYTPYMENNGTTSQIGTANGCIYYLRPLTGSNAGKVWIDILAYVGDEENVTLPDYTTLAENAIGCTVRGYAFYQCYSVKTVHITEGVTTLSANAFYYCANLETVTFDQTTEGGYWNYGTQGVSGTLTRLTEENFTENNASLFNVENRYFQWNAN